jgi:carbamoyltransferase
MTAAPWVLGLNCSHNGSACLMHGDDIVVAIQEERLLGLKRAWLSPSGYSLAIPYCLETAGITARDLDLVVCCVLHRSSLAFNNVRTNPLLDFTNTRTLTVPHHMGHAVGAFGTSGWRDAAVLIVDGSGSHLDDLSEAERRVITPSSVGPSEVISMYDAEGTTITPLLKYVGNWLAPVPHLAPEPQGMQPFNSLGAMYSSVSWQIFGSPTEAGKVMGLAPYGVPTIPVEEFLVIAGGDLRFTCEVIKRFRHNDRYPQRCEEYQDLAASVQQALEHALLHLVAQLRQRSDRRNLVLAGGVALNSVANERVIRESRFANVFIMPAAEDSGTAVGAALYGVWQLTGRNACGAIRRDAHGRCYNEADVTMQAARTPYIRSTRRPDSVDAAVDYLCAGKTVGWFTDRCELGPRALGQRSLLCDPRLPHAKDLLNRTVKYRESFRPFAPVVLLEHVADWFDTDGFDTQSPFMLRVLSVRTDRRCAVPAIVHVDGTGRLQTVTRDVNGRYYDVVRAFFERTGVPVLLNTSLNTRGEPIVETPEDAMWCLLLSGLDVCVFDTHVIERDPAYTGPLDLVPVVVNQVEVQPQSGGFHLRWSTAWGLADVDLPARARRLVDVLPEVDGRSTGWEILHRLSKRCAWDVQEQTVIELLGRWRRMGAVALRPRDARRDTASLR